MEGDSQMSSKIKYAQRADRLTREDIQPKNVKERVNMFVDEDVVNAFREFASETPGGKYQTLMNQVLRAFALGLEDSSFDKKLIEFANHYHKRRA
jgi:uncharacterized protein (DUF4415 family)